MAETLKGRDKRAFNIWSFYSPKAGADIIVAGDPEYLHAHLLEGDPQVEHFRVGGDIYLDPDPLTATQIPPPVATSNSPT